MYMYYNFSISQNSTVNISMLHNGLSASLGQIAFDSVSNNLYWCDSMLSWIAMKPAYNSDNKIYRLIVQRDLKKPEGLALDPDDRYIFTG